MNNLTNSDLLIKSQDIINTYCKLNFKWDFDPLNPIVRLHEPTFNSDEINAAIKQMLSTQVTMGKEVREFENKYAENFSSNHAVMSNSGSSANLLAISTLTNINTNNRLRVGDEVIVPALSWATSVWPIIQHGLIPVIVDCERKSYNIDCNKLVMSITSKTKAIMLVHVYGNPCNMDDINQIVKKYNLFLIEDTCESMGASFRGKPLGSFGDLGTFSFYYSHHITTFEGGITITNNFEMAETLRMLRAHGWSREADEKEKYATLHQEIDPRFIFVNLGYNLRPTEIQAVMGKIQLTKLNNFVNLRRQTYNEYRKRLDKYSEFLEFQQEQENGISSWFGFGILVKESAKFNNKELIKFLNLKNIETRPIIAGNIARHPVMKNYEHRAPVSLENSDYIMNNGFAIGCHHSINSVAIDYVCKAFDDFMTKNISSN